MPSYKENSCICIVLQRCEWDSVTVCLAHFLCYEKQELPKMNICVSIGWTVFFFVCFGSALIQIPGNVQNHPNPSCGWIPTVLQLFRSLALVTRMVWLDVRCVTEQFRGWGGGHQHDVNREHSWLSTDPARVSDVVISTQKPRPVSAYFDKWTALLILKSKKRQILHE